ncbi:MAG: hypothetical protein H6742_16410 [Alphaproteobacteria bacterium]|nr:hypothetical protein [Alphaproteobacteria bacterium]
MAHAPAVAVAASSPALDRAAFGGARIARRIRVASLAGPRPGQEQVRFDPEQLFLETALRGRAARQVRTWLRRMDPVFVRTPRWSRPQTFLEDVALDLAVGEPAIGCRTVGFRPLKSRGPGSAWTFLLDVFGHLGRGSILSGPATVADREGFRWALAQCLEDAHSRSQHRLAVLLHGVEHLPVEVFTDLTEEWAAYQGRHPEGVRVALLVAGAERPRWLQLVGMREIELEDFGLPEAIAALVQATGPISPRRARALARFTGGIPAVIDALAPLVVARGDRLRPEEVIEGIGGLGDEIRGALDIVSADDHLADRLHTLSDGDSHTEYVEVDDPLIAAGLVRRVRSHGLPHVALRAPALAQLIGA